MGNGFEEMGIQAPVGEIAKVVRISVVLLHFPTIAAFSATLLESIRKAPDTFNFLRHVMRAIWSSDQSALIDASL